MENFEVYQSSTSKKNRYGKSGTIQIFDDFITKHADMVSLFILTRFHRSTTILENFYIFVERD